MPIDSPIPPQMIAGFQFALERLARASEQQTAAILAAAIITTRGTPVSAQETLDITNTIHMGMYPPPLNSGHGKHWADTKDARLSKVHD